ncbi:hypothetical protein D3C79_1024480 [compost metagenome]
MLLRDHQEVHGRLGGDVVEGEDLVVLVEFARGDLPGSDFAEQTVHGNSPACYKKPEFSGVHFPRPASVGVTRSPCEERHP